MVRIESYIDDIIKDLERSLEILNNFGAEEVKITRIQSFLDTFNTRNVQEIIDLINQYPNYFYSTPAAPLLYEINLNNEYIFNALESGDYKLSVFSYISLQQFFENERAKKWLDSLSQDEYDRFIEENLRKFTNDTPEYLATIFDRYSKQEDLISSLYYDHIKAYVIANSKTAHLLLDTLSSFSFNLESEDYQKLWDNHQEYIKKLSIEQKRKLLSQIKSKNLDLLPTVLKGLNIIDNVSLYGFSFEEIIPYFDEEDKIQIFFNLLAADKKVSHILELLSTDIQRELLNDKRFLDAELSDYNRKLAYDAMTPELFDEYMDTNIMTNDRLLTFYKKTKDKKYFERLKNILLNSQTFNYEDDWLYDESFYMELSSDELSTLVSVIDYPTTKREVQLFFNSALNLKHRTPFVDVIISKSLQIIKENPGTKVAIYSSSREFLTEEELITIFDNMTLEQQISEMFYSGVFLKQMVKRIQSDPDCYKGLEVDLRFTSINNSIVDEFSKEIETIFWSLDECHRNVFYIDKVLNSIPSLVEPYRKYVLSNPSELSKVIEKFFTEEELIRIYEICPIQVYTNIFFDSLIKKDTSFYDRRVDDFIEYVNDGNYCIGSWYKNFSSDGLNKFLYGIKCSKVIEFISDLKNKELRNKVINRVINEIHSLDLIDISPVNFKNFISHLNVDEINMLVSKVDDYGILLLFNKIHVKVFEQELMNRYLNRGLELGMSESIIMLSRVLVTLSPENKTIIERDIEEKLNDITQFDNIKNLLTSNVSKLSFIYCVNNGLINHENANFVFEMLSKDPFLFDNLDTRLLRNEIMAMGEHFIKKTSRYPIVARKFMDIVANKPELYPFMIAISQKLNSNETSSVYDKKMEFIINYLTKFSIGNIDYENINDDVLANIEDYILQHYRLETNKNNKNFKYGILGAELQCDIKHYHQERKRLLDDMIGDMQDINQLRNLFYNRYFGLDYDSIKKFLYSYASNYSDVCEYASNDYPLKYIQLIEKIESINDFKTLVDLYNAMSEEYTISDYMNIVGIMTAAYNKANSNIVNNGLSNNKVKKKFIINGKEVEQEVTEVTGSYGLFVHSTDAYGSMEMINDDYFESWNFNSNTENHGICCCYITNMSYGTANVKGKGVLFGFNQVNEHSIAMMAPYDLMTRNDGYNITSVRPPLYMRMDKVSSYTRHTHNEFCLERRNDTLEKQFPCIQPNCVVIFEEMSDEIKANSFKAVEDFRKRGIELNIVYIDRVKNLKNEASIIERGLDEFNHTGNLHQLAIIMDRYESNLCGCDFIKDINIHEILLTERIQQAIQDTINNIKTIDDIYKRNALAQQLKDILDQEQYKFDIIKETVGDRAHKFHLYSDDIKIQLEELLQAPNILIAPEQKESAAVMV